MPSDPLPSTVFRAMVLSREPPSCTLIPWLALRQSSLSSMSWVFDFRYTWMPTCSRSPGCGGSRCPVGVRVAGAVLPTRTRARCYDASGNELRSFAAAEDAVQDALVEAVRLVGLGRQLASEPDRFAGVWS